MHLLGVDCSDIRVHAVLAGTQGNVLASDTRPLLEVDNLGPALRAVLDSLLPRMTEPDTTAVVALPQGYRVERNELTELLGPLLTRCRRVWRCSSMEAVAAGALQGQPGLVVHCGLRSAAIGIHADGRMLTGGHADTPLGDEGSALWLAVRLLRVVQQGLNGRTPRNLRVEQAMRAYFGAESFEVLLDRLERGAIPASELAGFVSVILQMATYPDPDPASRVLVLQAARHLISLARYVIEHCGFGDDLPSGSWSGPAFNGPLLEEFSRVADVEVPETTWHPPAHDAAEGCLMLALAGASQSTDDSPAVEPIPPTMWSALFKLPVPWRS